MPRSILLLSGSYVHGSGYLEPYEEVIVNFTSGISSMIFVPYAAAKQNWDSYTEKARIKCKEWGINITGIHEPGVCGSLDNYEAIFVGGGNTFRLLHSLQKQGLLNAICKAVNDNGMRYMGSSAGSNIACPTICTTNDMPIIYPEAGFGALNLVSFQLNPHYIDPDITSKHMGETREDRIKEFHEVNATPVVGLREGAYLEISEEYYASGKLYLGGNNGAKFFFPGKDPIDITTASFIIFQKQSIEIVHI